MDKRSRVITLTVVSLVMVFGFIKPISAAVSTFVGKGLVIFDSIRVGRVYLRGSLVNDTKLNGSDNPVTIKDNLRIDGNIFNYEQGAPSALKFADNLHPAVDATYSLGISTKRFINLYLSGSLVGTGVVGTDAIANSAVTAAKIADGTIAAADLADGAITSAKLLDGTIATADLADSSVTSAKLVDGTVVNGDLAGDAVTADKIIDASNVAGLRKADLGVFSAVVSVDPPNVLAGTCGIASVIVSGVAVNDIILANPVDNMPNKLIAVVYDVLTTNTIDFQFCNVSGVTGGAAIDDTPKNWRVLVLR